MSARFQVGDRVNVAAVYELPPKNTWDEVESVELAPIPNDLDGVPAVLIGVTHRKWRAEVGENSFGRSYLDWQPGTKAFYVVRYTLRGRRYLTLAEHMTVVDSEEATKR